MTTGWAVFAVARAVHAPPKTEWVAPSGATATTSLSQALPVRTASRPAISLPSADVAIRTATGSIRSTSAASTPTCGVRKSAESDSAT